ncbi:MAG: hypothetical protein EPO21_06045 [Chloroflexota bacterium]|nr:MAG: hypothetical protein EPO21_06045 [Chloroflexota bacterium]
MATRKVGNRKPRQLRSTPTESDIHSLLDRIDQAVMEGDAAALTPLIERLWDARRQGPEVLTRRLLEGRAQVPAFAFELLGGLAGPQTPRFLKRIAENPGVTDMVRFGAQRRAGWPERGEAKRRLAFLASLRDGEAALVTAAAEATLYWPPDGEILAEVLGYLSVLPAERRRAVLNRATAELHARSTWLLRAVLHLADPVSQRFALAELVRLGDRGAIGPIERVAHTAQTAEIRDEAAAAVRRLRMHVVNGTQREEAMELPPVERVLMSTIDGDGGQVILVVRKTEAGALLIADFFSNELYGVKDSFGLQHATEDVLEEMIGELEESGIELVEVDLAAARGALAAAVEVNAATRHSIPPVFELWEPLVYDAYPPREDETIVRPELDDAPYANRPDLIRSSGRLADRSCFDFWLFDLERTILALDAMPVPKGYRWSDKQFRPLVQQLLDSTARELWRRRLRRQAWLLDRQGDSAGRDQSLAVAAQLAEGQVADLAKQPFIRTLLQRTVGVVVAEMAFEE